MRSEHNDVRHGSWRVGWKSVVRRLFTPAIMVIGMALCVWALYHLLERAVVDVHLTTSTALLAILSGTTALVVGALAWDSYFHSWVGRGIGFSEALAQNGLVLVGKYVPGKVAGVAARIMANPFAPARQVIAATFMETLGSVAVALAVGALLMGFSRDWHFALAAVLFSAIAWWLAPHGLDWCLRLSGRWSERLRGWQPADNVENRAVLLRSALAWQALQWVALSALVSAIAMMVLAEFDALALVRVAGAYAVAVGCGAVLFIFPGGIGPREGAFVWLVHESLGMEQALAVALLSRIATTLIDLAGAACWLVLQNRRK